MESPLVVWHGSHGWESPPRIKEIKKGRYECGPGIYGTTSLKTALKYAKGGGKLVRLEIDPEVTWLEIARLTKEEMLTFVRSLRGLRNRKNIEQDLEVACARHNEKACPAAYLVNLLVNHEALLPSHGPEVANFLVEKNIDVSLAKNDMSEQWIVIFNPKKILKSTPISKSNISVEEWELPPIRSKKQTL